MADGGKVIIKIDGDDSGFRKVSGSLGNLANGAFKAVSAGAVVATGAIAAVGTASVKAYSEYEQLKGGVETLFKSSSGTLINYANQAYQTAGMSANKYMESVTSFSAAMIQSLGGDTAAAAELSNKAIIDMSDNANKMGTSIESIIQTYQSLSRGNFGMLDNLKLGYGGTKKELQRLLDDAEAYKKSMGEIVNYDISNFADIVKAIGAIQEKLEITGTTAKEASTTIQGSAMAMKAAWDNLLVGMADPTQDINVLMDNLVSTVEIFAGNLMPVVNNALGGISSAISGLLPEMIGEIPALLQNVIPDITAGVGGIVDAVVETITGHQSNVGNAISSALNGAIETASTTFGTLVEVFSVNAGALTSGLPLLTAAIDGLGDAITILSPAIVPATAAIIGYNTAVGLASTATTLFTTVTTALSNPIGMVGAAIGLGTAAVIGIKTAVDEANMSFFTMGEELAVLSEGYAAAKENALITEEYASSWYALNDAINNGTLPANELAAAEERRKQIEEWFISNYSAYIDAEQQKNGIRGETIGIIQKQVELLTEAQKIELENEVLETKSRVPELQEETKALEEKNKKLSTQNTELLKNNNTVLKSIQPWQELSAEQKASGEYQEVYKKCIDDVNKALGTNFTQMEQMNSAMEINKKAIAENNSSIESNNKKLAEGQKSLDNYKNACKQLIEIDLGSTLDQLAQQTELVKQAQAELEKTGSLTQETTKKLAETFPELADALNNSKDKGALLEAKMLELQGKFDTAKLKAQEFGTQLELLPDTVTIDLVFNVPKIPRFAKGTKGAKKGPAVVNDGRGPELIQGKDGSFRMFKSSGAILTWLNAGDKVYTAEQTRTLLKKIPHYANGIGNDELSLFDLSPYATTPHTYLFNGSTSFSVMGESIIKGIIEGIDSNADELNRRIEEMSRDILNITKKELDIKVFSRKFRDEVGAAITAGITAGIKNSKDSMIQAIEDSHKAAIEEMEKKEKEQVAFLATDWGSIASEYEDFLWEKDTHGFVSLAYDAKYIMLKAKKNAKTLQEILEIEKTYYANIENIIKAMDESIQKVSDYNTSRERLDTLMIIGSDDRKYDLSFLDEEHYNEVIAFRTDAAEMIAKTEKRIDEEITEERKDAFIKSQDEIAENRKKNVEDAIELYQGMASKAIDAIDEIGEKQEELYGKFKSNFELLEQEENGKLKLADLSYHTEGMTEYYNNLRKLKSIVPEELYNEILGKSIKEGGSFMYTFFEASDKEREEFLRNYKNNHSLAEELSKAAYVDEAVDVHTQVMNEFEKTPEEFFQLGKDSADKFGNGFIETMKNVLGDVRRSLASLLSNIMPEVAYAGANSKVYNDNSNVTIIAGSVSEHEMMEKFKQNKIYEEQVRGW